MAERRRRLFIAAAAALTVVSAAVAVGLYAHSTRHISGQMIDASGAGVARCPVFATATSAIGPALPELASVTGPDGSFSVRVRPGSYELTTPCSTAIDEPAVAQTWWGDVELTIEVE